MKRSVGQWIDDILLHPKAGPITPSASANLDAFRATAAFLVLIAHWRTLFFIDGSRLKHLNAGVLFFYWITKLGHQAVVVFFVLSGFLVGRTVLRPVRSKTWSSKRYLIHRLVRLEIVLVPALILCWIWDVSGIRIFHPSAVYMGKLVVLPYNVANSLNAHTFLGNTAFLQTVFVHTFGSDDPLWSLANEFWYYILFPCIVISISKTFSPAKRVTALLLWISIAVFFGLHGPSGILSGFSVWLFGAAISLFGPPSWLPVRFRFAAVKVLLFFLVVQLMLTYSPLPIEKYVYTDYILGIIFAVLIYFVLHNPRPVGERFQKNAKYTAGMSYTLYVTHMPVLVFLAAWLGHRWIPSFGIIFMACGILCFPLIYAALLSIFFERNTDRVRKRLEALMGLRQDSFTPGPSSRSA